MRVQMGKVRYLIALLLGLMLSCGQVDLAQARLRVGVTLHPYYSFVKNIVGDKADVVAVIPGEVNPHGYEPQAEDIKRALDVDVIVVNGIGHDEFIFKIIEASGRKDKLPLIYANASVALIPIGGDQGGEKIVNPHTFISTNAAIQQVYEIARRLGEIEPANAETYRRNGRDYATKIRQLRAQFMQQIAAHAKDDFRAATMHAGYDYLFQEFGLRISAVVEPRHGVAPTAKQLAQTIADIKAANVSVIFAEQYFGGNLAETVQRETGVRVYTLSHITDGPFTADKFEVEMRQNIETLARALEGK
ncbi:MAG: ABC transporter substrate-binding protein [Alphaproteobacteria bacterium]|nr:ABC transporter substrate-binding protein [Alphaproteobacteria bacterium]